MYRIHISADFDTEAEAEKGMADAIEAIGKNDGSVEMYETEDLEGGE